MLRCRIMRSIFFGLMRGDSSNMKTFFDSDHCFKTMAHCRTCRNKEGGRALREGWVKIFDDVKESDFECPNGLPWGAPKQELKPGEKQPTFEEVKAEVERIVSETGDTMLVDALARCNAQLDEATCKGCARNGVKQKLGFYLAKYKSEQARKAGNEKAITGV